MYTYERARVSTSAPQGGREYICVCVCVCVCIYKIIYKKITEQKILKLFFIFFLSASERKK